MYRPLKGSLLGGLGIFTLDRRLNRHVWKATRQGLRRRIVFVERVHFVVQFIEQYAAAIGENTAQPSLPVGAGLQGRSTLFDAMLRSLENYVLACFEHEQLLATNTEGISNSLVQTIEEFALHENDTLQDTTGNQIRCRTLVFIARGFLEKTRQHAWLLHEIDRLPAGSPFKCLKRIKPRHLFRFFLDGDTLSRFAHGPWNDPSLETTQLEAGAFMFDQGEPGYISSILTGFLWLLRKLVDDNDFRINSTSYEELHQQCFDHPFDANITAGYRGPDQSVGYGLKIGDPKAPHDINREVSHEGALFMQASLSEPVRASKEFGVVYKRRLPNGQPVRIDEDNWEGNYNVRVDAFKKEREHIVAKVDRIFKQFYESIEVNGLGVNGKCRAIAECLLRLNSHHVFRDGNGRLSVNILLPLFTMCYAGLYPTVPKYPNRYSGESPEHLADLIQSDSRFCKSRFTRSMFSGGGRPGRSTKAYKFAKNRFL